MATEIVSAMIADRWLYLSEDGTVVEKGDTRARTLLAAPGSLIEPATAQRYGLSVTGGKVSQAKPKDAAESAREAGMPLDLGRVNEGQIREPGERLVLTPRTGVMKPEPAERVVLKHGDDVEMVAKRPAELVPKAVAPKIISNVPPEDDELRAEVAEETDDPKAREAAEQDAADAAAQSAKETQAAARKAGGKRGKGK